MADLELMGLPRALQDLEHDSVNCGVFCAMVNVIYRPGEYTSLHPVSFL